LPYILISINLKTMLLKKSLRLAAITIFTFFFLQNGSAQQHPEWWEKTVFYQIYMPSFQDSDNDGYSDFRGMTARLDYLKSLGIGGIWLTPFLQSPKVDNGYDVADYYSIDPVYGQLTDFKKFISEAHKRNIKVIMDMVLNHTSTDCRWFRESRKSKENPYRNFYVWKEKPNNWESFFGGNAWQYDPLTKEYYLHKFAIQMADLNWTYPPVIAEISKVLRFWLDLSVDGFRFDVVNFYYTNDDTADNPVSGGKQQHIHDINQPGIKQAVSTLKKIVAQYPGRFTVGEVGNDQIDILKQYQSPELLDVVFNFNFGSIPSFSVERIFNELQSMEKNMSGYPTLFFGSHDNPRLIDRLAPDNKPRALSLAALILTAKGIPFIYYGEEIGMKNITADDYGEIADVQGKNFYRMALEVGKTTVEALKEGNDHNRDKSRSPMQWDGSEHAGFSEHTPWIKAGDNYKKCNVEYETKEKNSFLSVYKQILKIRNGHPALQTGNYVSLKCEGDGISFTRASGSDTVSVYINFGKQKTIQLPASAKILMGKPRLKSDNFLIYQQ